MESLQLIAANRPGVSVARWHTSHFNELILEIFQETPVDSGLLEAIVLSVVLLRSGRCLGDSLVEAVDLYKSDPTLDPIYFLAFALLIGKSITR